MNEQIQSSKSITSISVKLPPTDSNYEGLPTYRPTAEVSHAPPTNTPVSGPVNQSSGGGRQSPGRNGYMTSARKIEKCWLRYRDRQMFKLLKHSICAAEHSLSYEILRKVAPKEAEFFKDPSCNIRVRFRFGGSEFPPEIFFKIFMHSESAQVKYITGKKVLNPNTDAAREACDMMGPRRFYDLIIQDAVHQHQHRITDEIDVITSKDYMQYLSLLDETPAHLGGKENYWRRLTLHSLPRTTIFFDLLEFAYSKASRMTPRLRREIPVLMARPVTQEIQRHHIRIISQLRPPIVINDGQPAPSRSRLHTEIMDSARSSGRRSKQAQQRSARMRQMYENEGKLTTDRSHREVTFNTERTEIHPEENWEDDEAEQLYQWSQALPIDDVTTPRYHVDDVATSRQTFRSGMS